MHVECSSCGASGDASPPAERAIGFLACPDCGEPATGICVSDFAEWIESEVERKAELQRRGRIGTRIQTRRQTDAEISRDGIAAELAACLFLCPGRLDDYMASSGVSNRGRDLPQEMTGLNRPCEIKATRYCGSSSGYLLVRPPRMTPGRMLTSYIDDSIYVLLHGQPFFYRVLGWTDRDGLIRDGIANPVPMRAGQRECWGIHWSQLRPLKELAERFIPR